MGAWFAQRGHDVEVIAGLPHYPSWTLDPSYKSRDRRQEVLEGSHVRRAGHFIPRPHNVRAWSRILMETSFSLSAARYWIRLMLSSKKPDVIIAVMPPLQIGMWPAVYSRIRKVPWVLHVQDLQVDAALRLNMLNVGRLAGLLYKLEQRLLRSATRVSTITEAMRDRIYSKGIKREQIWLFPNWAELSFVKPMARENAFRERLGYKSADRLIVCAGNMGEKQGLEVVLEAAERLHGDPRVQFLMVGDGAARSRLERMAAVSHLENLRFLPVQPWSMVPQMMAAADIHLVIQKKNAADLVMPSKLTNILSAGRSCIVTANPGTMLADVVSNHQLGLVVPPEDPEALADAVLRLLANDEPRTAYGVNARIYAEGHLDQEKILTHFEKQLLSLT